MAESTNNPRPLAEHPTITAARQVLAESRERKGIYAEVIARAAGLETILGMVLEVIDQQARS